MRRYRYPYNRQITVMRSNRGSDTARLADGDMQRVCHMALLALGEAWHTGHPLPPLYVFMLYVLIYESLVS